LQERGIKGVRMNKERLAQYRSEVIERFINIETIINAIISQHYFKRVLKPFYFEVLYDEYFSFALRRRILEKIAKDIDSQKVQDLNRLNTVRNYFAHCNQEIFEGPDIPDETQRGKIIDPRNTAKEIDFDGLYTEFMIKAAGVEGYLFKLYKDMGGIAEGSGVLE